MLIGLMIGGTILSLVGVAWVSKKAKKEINIALARKNSLDPKNVEITNPEVNSP